MTDPAAMPDAPAPKSRPRSQNMRVHCPHCGEPARMRTSKSLTALYREIYYHCSNVFCGHTFMATHEIVRTICPSLRPNPKVRLPLLAAASFRARQAGTLHTANDDDLPGDTAPDVAAPLTG